MPVRTSGGFKNIKELLITELCIITSDKLCKFLNCPCVNKWRAVQWRPGPLRMGLGPVHVAFLRGPYPATVHHVGGFVQVSHKRCCDVGILKKMVRVALQIVELLRFKHG